jgi:hypothetical protein
VCPFGPVRTVPTEPADPELMVSDPALPELVEVVPDPAGATVEEVVVEPADDVPELHAAAVTATAARRATSVQRLRPDRAAFREPNNVPRLDPRGNLSTGLSTGLSTELSTRLSTDLNVDLGMYVSELGWSCD